MKNKFIYRLIVFILLIVMIIFVIPQISNAAVLQSNPRTATPTDLRVAKNWFLPVRQMEASGQALGLSETINSSSGLGTTPSNNIDVHMIKPTEYGAMIILSASGFGNPSSEKFMTWSTGNKSGIHLQSSVQEYSAGGGSSTNSDAAVYVFSSKARRYYNYYKASSFQIKPGDALDLNWHSATAAQITDASTGYVYGGPYGVFGRALSKLGDGGKAATTRAIIVNGVGL